MDKKIAQLFESVKGVIGYICVGVILMFITIFMGSNLIIITQLPL